jgi:predicted dehydrogenase
MKPIGVGVIGTGTFGQLHTRIYHEHPEVRLSGIADINERTRERVASQFGVIGYARYEELLEDPKVEAVSIVLPDPYHREPCLKAAEAGKHILLEKPLATTLVDAEAILQAVERHGVKLMVDFSNRWNPPFALARQSIKRGDLGDLLYMNIKLNDSIFVPTRMLSWAGESSVLWFLGSHTVDLSLWLFERPLKRVLSSSRSRVLKARGIPTADFHHSRLEFEDGAVVNMENSWILPDTGPTVFEFKAEIVGTEGKIDIDTARNGSFVATTAEGYGYSDTFGLVEIEGTLQGFAQRAIDHFIDCVMKDREPQVSKASSLEVTRVIGLLEQSARSGRAVET